MKYFIILVSAILLKQCGNQHVTTETLSGDWTIKELKGTATDTLKSTDFHLDIPNNTVATTVGCNMHNCEIESITLDKNKMSFKPCIVTEMFCKDLNDYEMKLKEALENTTQFHFKNTSLQFKDDAENVLLILEK